MEKGPTQGLEHTLSEEKMYSINFTETKQKKFVLAWAIITKIVIYLLMAPKLLNLNQNSEILPHPLCLGNISKHWSVDNLKKTELNG